VRYKENNRTISNIYKHKLMDIEMEDIASLLKYSNSLNVLYVEDNDALRTETTNLLKNFFLTLDTAEDGIQGIELHNKNRYDLIISDIVMPNLDGISMIKKIKEENGNQKFILLSAYDETHYFLDAITLGIDGYLVKPLQLNTVVSIFKKVSKDIKIAKEHELYQDKLRELVDTQTKTIQKTIQENAQQLIKNSRIDTLTGLLNHAVLQKDILTDENFAVILFNIVRFDAINKIYGYEYGDEVLKKTASKIDSLLPENANLYRIGCDEFVCILKDYTIYQPQNFAQIVIDFFKTDITLDNDIKIQVNLSVGISDSSNKNSILNAKIALQEAKKKNISQNTFSEKSEFISSQKETILWMYKIKDALKKDQIEPFFQPIINNSTLKVEKYEALARIILPLEDGGIEIITPNQFIEAARLTGLITDVTRRIISKSFETFSSLSYSFSINITADDLMSEYLGDFLLTQSNIHNVNPNRVIIEILENLTAFSDEKILKQLNGLKKRGFRLAVDDFGTENSNFSRLLDINADCIKIDGKFIKNINHDKKSEKIVQAIIFMADKIGAKVIAEFVHNKDVFTMVQSLGVHYSQGYYFSKPLQAKDLKKGEFN